MDSLRLVEGKVKLELSNQIYRFIKAITDYEMFVTEQEFEMDLPEARDSPRFKLLRPFKDDSMLRRDIKEFAWVIGVDSQMNGLFVDLLSIGDVNRTVVEPWAPFRGTFVVAASAIILAHNHPSGNVRPSESDIKLTKMTIEGGIKLRRPLLDHMIIGDNDYFSMDDDLMLAKLTQEVKEEIAGVEQMRILVSEEKKKLKEEKRKRVALERENSQVQQESERLQQESERLQQESERLQQESERLQQESERLKKENDQLKALLEANKIKI